MMRQNKVLTPSWEDIDAKPEPEGFDHHQMKRPSRQFGIIIAIPLLFSLNPDFSSMVRRLVGVVTDSQTEHKRPAVVCLWAGGAGTGTPASL